MITGEQIAELAPIYEEYNAVEDPTSSDAIQVRLVYLSLCRKVYNAESKETREKWTFETYCAALIVPELLKYLTQQQTPYPSIQPERRG